MSAVLDPAKILTEIDPVEVRDLLQEFGDKNFVRVVKHEGRMVNGKVRYKEAMYDETRGLEGGKLAPTVASLLKIDSLRVATGKKPVYLDAALRRSGGKLISVSFNLRTTVGIDFAANALGGTSQPAVADVIALTNNTLGTSASHSISALPWNTNQSSDAAGSTSTGETNYASMGRASATYAHTNGVSSYTQVKAWTSTGTVTSLIMAGLFGGTGKGTLNSGTLFVENTFSTVSLVNTDTLTLTWTINI